jgi:hypothetical protein
MNGNMILEAEVLSPYDVLRVCDFVTFRSSRVSSGDPENCSETNRKCICLFFNFTPILLLRNNDYPKNFSLEEASKKFGILYNESFVIYTSLGLRKML